jgi:hypothetical protein
VTLAGFVVNEVDTCVYYHFGRGEGVVLCLYIDDILIFGTNINVINDVKLRYSQIIGSLMYLTSATRPDISFATSKLSRFTSNPGNAHWCALERVMRYLRGTTTYGLHYIGYPGVLEGYSDANWISDADEIKATSGYIFTIGGGAVF